MNKYPNEISGGQKQRTSAARALDSKAATALLKSLEDIKRQQQVTIMMVTHDAVAASFSSRVLFLKDGAVYTELYRGDKARKEFFQQILSTQSVLGGDGYES